MEVCQSHPANTAAISHLRTDLPTQHFPPIVILDPQCEHSQFTMQLRSQPMYLLSQVFDLALQISDLFARLEDGLVGVP